MCSKATIFLLAVCLSAPVFGSQSVAEHLSDTQLFRTAVVLSYDGNHNAAREKFDEYRKSHPDDLLVPIRVFYDHLFDVHASKMDKDEYQRLLHEADVAIALFESKKCAGTDLAGIAGDTLDCDYVGAALYSFRAVLRVKNESAIWKLKNSKVLRADDNSFFFYARRSRSLQAQFLLGVHEYEISQSILGFITGDPRDRDEALKTIGRSLASRSPFADDVWFYVLRLELKNQDGAQFFIKDHPPAAIIAMLQPKYPHNRMFGDGLSSFSDSFESH